MTNKGKNPAPAAQTKDTSAPRLPADEITIQSPYDVNETLLQAMPASLRARIGESGLKARRFEPVDRRAFQSEPAAFRQTIRLGHFSDTRLVSNRTRKAMAMTVVEPGEGAYTLGLRRRGTAVLSNGRYGTETISVAQTGLLYREQEGLRVAISDDHAGTSFELPYRRIVAVLEGLIERPVSRRIAFEPLLDTSTQAGERLRRVASFIENEQSVPGGRDAPILWGRTLEDLLIRSLLILQPHTYSSQLEGPVRGASPFNVKRAEAFMQAHACEAITVEQIAEASGCGVRSLQSAFRTFAGCSPMERLRIIRLDQAHLDLSGRTAVTSLRALATKFQFSNPGRFADQYRARFGHRPFIR